MSPGQIELAPIESADAVAISQFLHEHLNSRVSAAAWAAILQPPWSVAAPHHGFKLTDDGAVVGAYVAVYSEREIDGRVRRFCNLAAFCVLEQHRSHSFRLMRAILGQRGYDFTDFSPSGNVVALNERLGFTRLDTATSLALNLPRIRSRSLTVSDDAATVERVVAGHDAQVFADHRDAPAARHLVVVSGDDYGYLVVRKDRRKRLPLFATPLYVGGNVGLVRSAWPHLASVLLLRHGAVVTLAERRILGFEPSLGVALREPRAKMFRPGKPAAGADGAAGDGADGASGDGAGVDSAATAPPDYLYSELTLLEW